MSDICTPEARVSVPEGYDHYPYQAEDIIELLDDLNDAGLSAVEAAEAAGYATAAAIVNCANSGTIVGILIDEGNADWAKTNLSKTEANAFLLGRELAYEESRK